MEIDGGARVAIDRGKYHPDIRNYNGVLKSIGEPIRRSMESESSGILEALLSDYTSYG